MGGLLPFSRAVYWLHVMKGDREAWLVRRVRLADIEHLSVLNTAVSTLKGKFKKWDPRGYVTLKSGRVHVTVKSEIGTLRQFLELYDVEPELVMEQKVVGYKGKNRLKSVGIDYRWLVKKGKGK